MRDYTPSDLNSVPVSQRAKFSPAAKSVEPVCPYCKQADKNWLPADLNRGRRDTRACIEYHCYAGYCWD